MIQSHLIKTRFHQQMDKIKGFLNSESNFAETSNTPLRKTQTPRIKQNLIASIELSDQDYSSNLNQLKQIDVQSRNFNDEYIVGQKLGEGTHGIVRLCCKKDDQNSKYAVKIIKAPDEELMNMIRMTFLNTTILKSQYIAQSHKLYIEQDVIYMVMEYVPYGNLEALLKQKGRLSEQQVQKLIFCLLTAIKSLHSAGICHRDIKPDNIQVNEDDFNIKLIDFGVSRRFVVFNQSTFRYNRHPMLTVTGNINYRAPELYGSWGYGYDQQVDIWAVGVVTYQCLTGKLPIQSNNIGNIIEILSQREAYQLMFQQPEFVKLSPSCRDFIKRLMMWNPFKRLNASEAIKHIWMPYSMTPLKLSRKKAKDDIDASKISQNSDILNKSLINSAMILNQELKTTLQKSKRIEVIKEEDTPQIQQSLEFSITLKEQENEFNSFKNKLKQFKMEASQKIHTQLTLQHEIKFIDSIQQNDIEQLQFSNLQQQQSQMETSIDIRNGGEQYKPIQLDFFGLNICESQSSLTDIKDVEPKIDNQIGPNKSIDAELLQEMQKFQL